jgi:hypothetical protein
MRSNKEKEHVEEHDVFYTFSDIQHVLPLLQHFKAKIVEQDQLMHYLILKFVSNLLGITLYN